MPHEPMTADRLWSLPRVGTPAPLPDGTACLVPVTTYDMAANAGTTRLWRVSVAADDGGAGSPSAAAPRALTAADVSSSQPAVSPDGSRLAFVRKPGAQAGKGGKAKTDAAGKAPSSISGLAEGPARFGEVDQLWVMPLDGGEAVRLTDLPLGIGTPVWFPDGRRIAFIAPVYADAPTLAGTAERHKAREDDAVKAYVTEDRVYRYWDRWLTDGIVHHVFVLDVDRRELADVTPAMRRWLYLMGPGNGVSVSPDGTAIATDERVLPTGGAVNTTDQRKDRGSRSGDEHWLRSGGCRYVGIVGTGDELRAPLLGPQAADLGDGPPRLPTSRATGDYG